MLKHKKDDYLNTPLHLSKKSLKIVITNACNLSCGGCHQLCGSFHKDKIWFLTEKEFTNYIEIVSEYCDRVFIFGGEPTIHPEWIEFVRIMNEDFADVEFTVVTNGRLGHKEDKRHEVKEGNIKYLIMPKKYSHDFFSTLVAPIDFNDIKDPGYYWSEAKKGCLEWIHCGVPIYKNKVYFCEVAAALDFSLTGGENGWSLEDSVNPLERSEEEIEEQANKFCYRCGHCPVVSGWTKQSIKNKSRVSKTNLDLDLKKVSLNIIQ